MSDPYRSAPTKEAPRDDMELRVLKSSREEAGTAYGDVARLRAVCRVVADGFILLAARVADASRNMERIATALERANDLHDSTHE